MAARLGPDELVRVDERAATLGGAHIAAAGDRLAVAPARMVASAAGLVAMKATTVSLRASSKPEKRASDLYDLGRLLVAGRVPAQDLHDMPPALLVLGVATTAS